MRFEEIVDQALDMVRRRGRMSYRMLRRHFDLDDETLDDLKEELLYSQSEVVDDEGRGLIWIEGAGREPAPTISRPEPQPTAQERDPTSYTPQHLAEKILTSRSALEGERKQVTVMFCDIEDSTELIRDLDPEAAQQPLDPAIHIMMDAVHRFEGTVNQVLGDGIMALFGAPVANEDHAARACYAALALQTAMQPYTDEIRRKHGIEMQIRVGLNSGEVVVRAIGNDLHMDYSAVGSTTHLAARMEQLARPGSIRFPASTQRLVEGFVQVQTIGPVPVKGMTGPVEVFELTGASTVRRRLQAAVARGLTKFVGRDTEIGVLNQALEQAKAGNGQVVAVVGEAGLGKSRLFYEFIQSHRTQGWLLLESTSVSYGKATPYFPVIDLLKRYAHVEDGDDSRTIRAKVTGQILTLDESLQGAIPPLLSLLDTLPEDSSFQQLDPPQRRQQTFDALKRILLRESQVQPLLLVFEDLHWIDSETQALLDSLVESFPTAQLLLLVNYRPEYQHGWGSKTFYTQLRLDPLPPESADTFLEALFGNDTSLEPLKKLLIERTEGNPFFLEESVRTLVETQVLVSESGTYRLAQELPTIQVPATVQAILAARIDRLPQEEKRLLQTAAVIGTEVPFTLLHAICDLSEEALYRSLTHLQAAEFLYETSLYPKRIYTFKHALTHEIAYGSLLQERRRVLHARIVEGLEALSGEQSEQVERLAHHALQGAVWDKAVLYCHRAGGKAFATSAYREAVRYFEQVLAALGQLPPDHTRLELAVDVRLQLRGALVPFGQWEQALSHLRTAENIATELRDQRRLGRVYRCLASDLRQRSNYDPALAYCQLAHAIAIDLGDVDTQGWVQFDRGMIHCDLGQYRQAIGYLQEAMTACTDMPLDPGRRAHLPIHSRLWLMRCLSEIGEFASGRVYGEEARQMAEVLGRSYEHTNVAWRVGQLQMRQGTIREAIPQLEGAVAMGQEAELPLLTHLAATNLALAYALAGRVTDALHLWVHAEKGMHVYFYQAIACGEIALRTGDVKAAHRLVHQALAGLRTNTMRSQLARALWLLGDIAMHRDPPEVEQAETHYQQALTLATELGMRPLQAHCHRGLGVLYSQTGQSEQARAELFTAINMYRDMEMTFWLPETEVALADVAGKA